MANPSADTVVETKQQRFERLLSREPFKGLKVILDSVAPDREALWAGVTGTNSYEELLARLGYRAHAHQADPRGGLLFPQRPGGRDQGRASLLRHPDPERAADAGELRLHRDRHAEVSRLLQYMLADLKRQVER